MSWISIFKNRGKAGASEESVVRDLTLNSSWTVREKKTPSDNGETRCEWEFYDSQNRLRRKEVWTRMMYEDMHISANLVALEVYHYNDEAVTSQSWKCSLQSSPRQDFCPDGLVVHMPIDPEWALAVDRDDSLMNCTYRDKQNRVQRLEQWNLHFLGEDGWGATLDNVFVAEYKEDVVVNRRRTFAGDVEYSEWEESLD